MSATVTYWKRAGDESAVTDTFDDDREALVYARYMARDMLAVPVILVDSRGHRVYVSGRGGPTIGHRRVV